MFANSLTGVLLLTAAVLGAPKERVWTDMQGRTVTGVLVKQKDGQVTLRVNGRTVELPLTKLSQEDRDYLEAEDLFPSALKPKDSPAEAAEANDGSETDSGDSSSGSENSTGGNSGAKPKKVAVDRVWTDASGQSMKGRFVRMHEGKAVIQGTKIVSVPFHNLGVEDKQYLTELLEARGEAKLIPPVPAVTNPGSPQFAGGPQINPGGSFPNSAPPTFNRADPLQAMRERMEADNRQREADRLARQQQQEAEARQRDEQRRREDAERQQRYAQQQQEAERQRQEMLARQRQQDADRIAARTTPGMPSPDAFASRSLPNFPSHMVEQYQCEGCKHVISSSEATGSNCPYCGIYWARKPAGVPGGGSRTAAGVGAVVGLIFGLVLLLVFTIGPIVGLVFLVRWLISLGKNRTSNAGYATNYSAAAQSLTKPAYGSNPYQASSLDPSALIPLDDFSAPAQAPSNGPSSSPYQ